MRNCWVSCENVFSATDAIHMMSHIVCTRVERLELTHNIVQGLRYVAYSLHVACQFILCCLQTDLILYIERGLVEC